MRPFLPNIPHTQLPENSSLGLAFQAVNSVCLVILSSKVLLDMVRDRKEARHKPQSPDELLGPVVRREVERALAGHDGRRGRGS
jgi:hypothetical protein